MAKNDDLPWWLIGLGLLAGGGALAALMANNRTKPQLYSCYQCGTSVSFGMPTCPNCGAQFVWKGHYG